MSFRRRIELLLFAGVFGLGAYFYNGYGWNQTARYDSIWAFVEPGQHRYTFAIDDFVTDTIRRLNTGDWARNPDHSPHFYSNKAPGSTLLGIPAYMALYHGERFMGIDPVSVRGVLVNAYILHLWVTVLPLAVSAVFFFNLALRYTRRRGRALLLTGILYGGTLLLPFSTMLWAHTTAAAFVVLALSYFVRPGRRAAFLCGMFAGLAVLMDYGAAPLAASFVVAAVVHDERRDKARGVVFGGAGPLVVFLAYHWWVFGSPFVLASSYSPAEMVETERMLGLFGAVNPTAVWGLTFSTTRGLFIYMPVLVLAFFGLGRLRRPAGQADGRPSAVPRHDPAASKDDRIFWWLAVVNVVVVLLVNTTFNGWHGGFSAGPRYQIVALPLWVLLLALLPDRSWATRALLALGAVSFVNMFVVAAVSPAAPDAFRGSALLFCYAKVFDVLMIDGGAIAVPSGPSPSLGSLHLYPGYPMRAWAIAATDPDFQRWATFNLGERLMGLRGSLSLLPALLGALTVAWWTSRIVRTQDRRERLR